MRNIKSRLALSLILAAVLAVTLLPGLNRPFTGLFSDIDEKGREYIDEGLKKGIYAYAAARAANGVISVVQSSDLTVTPAGVGVKLALGEILDPVNDLIERFSWVMLASLTSLAIQKSLLEIGAWLGGSVLFGVSLGIVLAGLWTPHRSAALLLDRLGSKLLLAAVVVRLCIPGLAWTNQHIYNLFLEPRYAAASGEMQKGVDELESLGKDAAPAPESSGFWEGLSSTLDPSAWKKELTARIDRIKAVTETYVDNLVALAALFILHSIIMPLLMLYLLSRLLNFILKSRLTPAGGGFAALLGLAPRPNMDAKAQEV